MSDVIILRYCKRDMSYELNFSISAHYCQFCGQVMEKRKYREVKE